MSQPTLNTTTVDPNQAGWDATVESNRTAFVNHLTNQPLVIKQYANIAALPAAGSNDDTLAAVTSDTGENNGLYLSRGGAWVKVSASISRVNSYTLAQANALTGLANGDEVWISDGRKTGEGAGSGTGLRGYWDASSGSWLRHSDDSAVVT